MKTIDQKVQNRKVGVCILIRQLFTFDMIITKNNYQNLKFSRCLNRKSITNKHLTFYIVSIGSNSKNFSKMSKYIYIIIFNFLFITTIAQNFQPQYKVLSDSLQISDFSFLKNEIGDAQIILLGETSHFEGAPLEVKAKIIEYLHTEMGFNTLAFESGSFSLNKAMEEIKKGKTGEEIFRKSLFGIWGNVKEFQSTAKYYSENHQNLKLFGFDINQTGQYAQDYLIDDMYQYLKRKNIHIKLPKLDFKLLIESYDGLVFDEEIILYEDFMAMMSTLIVNIEKKETSTEDFYWKIHIRNLKAYSMLFNPNISEASIKADSKSYIKEIATLFNLDQNDLIEIGAHGFFVGKGDNFRDNIMAQNLLDYIERFPTEKIICWGANAHFINDMKSVSYPIIKDFIPMGSFLKKKLGDQVYSLGIITASDKIERNNIAAVTPIIEHSFEYFLIKTQQKHLFISSKQEAMKAEKKVRFFSNKSFVKGKLNEFHDGYLFIDDVSLSNALETKFKENRYTKRKNNTKATPRIIDSKTKEALAYVNVIVEGSHVGVISNEDGYLEANIGIQYQENIILISHLGYEELRIPYNQLNGVIELKPSVISLDEIVLKQQLIANAIMKNCVKKFKNNFPDHKMSFKRHFHVTVNKKDSLLFDLEFITRGHNKGYHRHWRTINELQEVKWNKESNEKPAWIQEFIYIQENAIMDGNYLQARKWKKFNFTLKESIVLNDRWLYVIDFITAKDFYTYTNRRTKSNYSGTLYIDQEDFGIVKVKENWKFKTPSHLDLNNKNIDSLENIIHLNDQIPHIKHREGWAKSYTQSFIHHETQITTYQKANNGYYYQKSSDLLAVGTLVNSNERHKYTEATRIDFYDYEITSPQVLNAANDKKWQFKYYKYNPEFWAKFDLKNINWFNKP